MTHTWEDTVRETQAVVERNAKEAEIAKACREFKEFADAMTFVGITIYATERPELIQQWEIIKSYLTTL